MELNVTECQTETLFSEKEICLLQPGARSNRIRCKRNAVYSFRRHLPRNQKWQVIETSGQKIHT